MNKKTITAATQDIRHVAQRMLDRGDKRGNDLLRIAQQIQELPPGQSGGPADVSMSMQPGQTLNDPSSTDPTTQDMSSGSPHHPQIPSFVDFGKGDNGPQVDNRKTHTCTVTFKAPPDVQESDMMNYILKIGDELGVDVDGFNWKKKDEIVKQSAQ